MMSESDGKLGKTFIFNATEAKVTSTAQTPTTPLTTPSTPTTPAFVYHPPANPNYPHPSHLQAAQWNRF
jgi:hypothetical protein